MKAFAGIAQAATVSKALDGKTKELIALGIAEAVQWDDSIAYHVKAAVDQCRWAGIEAACTGVPATLTHGDIQRKNIYIRSVANGPALFLIDWETAGWGMPASDLPLVDLPTYWSVVRPFWPHVRLKDVQRLAVVGRIFLQLAGIRWVSPELAYDRALYLSRPTAWLRVLHERIADAVRELEALT